MRILIVGAGKTGVFLAAKLHSDHEVTLLENRHGRVDTVRSMLPDVNSVEGDACEPTVLERAGIENVDIVVAATGDDEDNLVVAMLAKVYNVEKVYGRVNHPENEWLFDKEWGVDVAMSSPDVLYALIEKDVGFGDLITLLKMQANNVSVEEITLPESASMVGHKLAEIPLPPNVQVMAILASEGYVQIARGDTLLVKNDQILLLVEGEHDSARIREAFGIPDNVEGGISPGRARR